MCIIAKLYTCSPLCCGGFAFQTSISSLLIWQMSQWEPTDSKKSVLLSVTWPRKSTENQHKVCAISYIARTCQNYYVPLEVLKIWFRLVLIEWNLHRFSSRDLCKIAKVLKFCEIIEYHTFPHKFQVLELGCLVPLSTEDLETVKDIKRRLNALWATTVARKKSQAEAIGKCQRKGSRFSDVDSGDRQRAN